MGKGIIVAKKISSIGPSFHTPDAVLTIGATVTDGLTAAVGRHLELAVDSDGLAFVLAHLANMRPETLIAVAHELDKCNVEFGEPDLERFDRHYYERMTRIKRVVMIALGKDTQ